MVTPIIKLDVDPIRTRDYIYELEKKLKKYKKYDWFFVFIKIKSNPPIEIEMSGNMKMGFQGSVRIKLKDKEIFGEAKRARVTFYLGDHLETNDIPNFIMYANEIIGLWNMFIKDIINVIPPEYYVRKKWCLEITLLDKNCSRPSWLESSENNTTLLIEG